LLSETPDSPERADQSSGTSSIECGTSKRVVEASYPVQPVDSKNEVTSQPPLESRSRPQGFKLLTLGQRKTLFNDKRDDLYYKTFGRDVRKFLQDDFTDLTGYLKEKKDKRGRYFLRCLNGYAKHLMLIFNKGLVTSQGAHTTISPTNFDSEPVVFGRSEPTFDSTECSKLVCFLGSLINHREYKKACPVSLAQLSRTIYNTFNQFTKEKVMFIPLKIYNRVKIAEIEVSGPSTVLVI